MSPLVKNIGLAFVAGFVTSLAAFTEKAGDVPPTKSVAISVVAAAVYAGVRGAIGYSKARFGSGPFQVDTEAPVAE